MANRFILRGFGVVLGTALPCLAGAQTPIFINELHYDNDGTDSGEAVEIVGPAGTDLSGWRIVRYNGSTPTAAIQYTSPAAAETLTGTIPDLCGGYGVVVVNYPANGLQNGGNDGLALVDNNGDVVQLLSYEGALTASDGPAQGQTSVDIGVSESGATPVGASLQLLGTGTLATDFTWNVVTNNSFGTCNVGQSFAAGPDAPPQVSATMPVADMTDVANDASVKIDFSEPVSLTADAITIRCSASGEHGYTTSGGPTSFMLDPTSDFVAGERCTVSVSASGVADQDNDDPPDQLASSFSFSFTTTADPAAACAAPALGIHAVQGNGAVSPIVGQAATVQGVVVGDFQGSASFNGFYMQEESADVDNDPATSEGLFVFSNSPVQAGDVVRVTGTAQEFQRSSDTLSLTELSSVGQVIFCGTGGSVLPTSVSLPFDTSGNDPERYEGMLINLPQTLTVSENFNLGRFGELLVSSSGRLRTPTHAALPGADALVVDANNQLNQLTIDDGLSGQNPDPIRYPAPELSADNTLRTGYTVTGATGILDYAFDTYRLQPTETPTFIASNPRSTTPPLLERSAHTGQVRIASFNVLNYFNGDGTGGGFPTSRGADTLEEFTRQRAKTIAAIHSLDADVVGLIEMENDGFGPNSALQDIVNGLNEVAGAGTWALINPFPTNPDALQGGDQIKVALIYRPALADPIGISAILDNSVDIRAIDTQNRPALAQTFRSLVTNDRFTAVINHLKSKGSACNTADNPGELVDPDTGDQQGNCNLTRLSFAQALTDWIATNPTGSNDPDVILLGDMNAYRMEDPIRHFQSSGYTDLITALNGDDTYSFVFNGASGYLDHALVNGSLLPQVKAVAEWHINADEPRVLDYNVEFKTANQVSTLYSPSPFRASDHDPVLVQLLTGGDLNHDGRVDAADRHVLLAAMGSAEGSDRYNPEADYDNNGRITGQDMQGWKQFFDQASADHQ